jgi:hypothetical protein
MQFLQMGQRCTIVHPGSPLGKLWDGFDSNMRYSFEDNPSVLLPENAFVFELWLTEIPAIGMKS